MLIFLIELALGISALYGFGAWVFMFVILRITGSKPLTESDRQAVELYTFHLGICAIAAAGFLGLILVYGG